MSPLVSVIVTSFNHAKYIGRALDSVYAQTYKNIEVIVVDDASSDGSQTIIKKYQERYGLTFIERMDNYYSSSQKIGDKPIIQAMNQARGEYIAVVDSDDYIYPNKLMLQVRLMEKNLNASLCYGGIHLRLQDNSRHDYITEFPQGDLFEHLLIKGNFLLYIGCLIRRNAYLAIERSPPDLLQEDWDMFLRLAKIGPFISHKHAIACYCRHDNNTWFRGDREILMYVNRMAIMELWQQEDAWAEAMNHRWENYFWGNFLCEDDIDLLLLSRPNDALLYFLKYCICFKRDEHTTAQRYLYKAMFLCDVRLAVLPHIFILLLPYFRGHRRQLLLNIIQQRCPKVLELETFRSIATEQ